MPIGRSNLCQTRWICYFSLLLLTTACEHRPVRSDSDSNATDSGIPLQKSAPASKAKDPHVAAGAPSVFAEFARNVPKKSTTDRARADRPAIRFADKAQDLGLDFIYQNGARGEQLMVEATGGGAGWLDYDNDGWLDIYLCQGGKPYAPVGPDQPRDEIFRSRFGQKFESVTSQAGIDERGYGQGVCTGDYDNDGFVDILVTNVGPSRLYRNCGDGTFQEEAIPAGLRENGWATSAAWGDIDRDGDLDLYMCRYCLYDPRHPQVCLNAEGLHSICHPSQVKSEPDEFYLNQGDGTFVAASRGLGLYGEQNRALGVVIADFNNDHFPDVFVANDTTPNYLYISEDGKHFAEQAKILGCAVSAEGSPQANMGVACGDFDRNGYLDLYVTHFSNEWNALYVNDGPVGFSDRSAIMQLVTPTLPMLAFGTTMHDFNGDGWMELMIANGHINERRPEGSTYAQIPQLFSYNGDTWDEIGSNAGPEFHVPVVGRGVAVADYDRDGRIDLILVTQNTPTKLLHNESEGARLLQIDCIGRRSNRQAVGTRAKVIAGGMELTAEIYGGGSYCSSQELTLTFGLGAEQILAEVELIWPSGIVQKLHDVQVPQRITVLEPDE